MSNAVFYCCFKLKKSTDVSAFLEVAKELNDEFISMQNGYISWQQLNDGDTWLDFITFETMEDVRAFEANSANPGELALQFYSFINMNSCKVKRYLVERSYQSVPYN